MPNTGKPSQDCHLCRQRRVKCDLARPACQRCIKYGAVCPGYRDQQDLMFRNANPHTVKKRRRRGAHDEDSKSNPDSSSSSDSNDGGSTSKNLHPGLMGTSKELVRLAGVQSGGMPLTKSLNEHWTAHSIPIILNVYSTINFLKEMYNQGPTDGPLVWAAHLFSRTYTTNLNGSSGSRKDSDEEAQREMASYMGKTLHAVGEALSTTEGAFRDDILATVWILANYELLIGSIRGMHPVKTSPWHLHAHGLHSILKTRGIRQLRTDIGRAAFWSAFNIVQIEALISTTEGPPEAEYWFSIIREELHEGEPLALLVSVFIHKISKIQCRMLNILRSNDWTAAQNEYLVLMGDLTEAENEAERSFRTVPLTGDSFDTYWRNSYCAAIVKGYHIAHMLVNYLTHFPPQTVALAQLQAQREYCLQRTRTAASEILVFCNRVLEPKRFRFDKSPKNLFDAFKLIWPLTSVYIIPSTMPEQKTQAEMALYFIGKELGIRQALHTYPGSSAGRVPLEATMPAATRESEHVAWMGKLRWDEC